MKINWNQNPFLTTVELDQRDKEMLLSAYQKEEYENILCDLDLHMKGSIKKDIPVTVELVHSKISQWGEICNISVESDEILNLIKAVDYPHCGDCICLPCSCLRCQVEEMLGIDTIKNLGKHPASKIYSTFNKESVKTIDDAIFDLEKEIAYKKPDKWPEAVGYEVHIPRWEAERKSAVEWLKAYKQEHRF